jgi:poly-gamma-glutamate capsule biosynthesis protein CapA/YwtB (metallophosphatase superfamily)
MKKAECIIIILALGFLIGACGTTAAVQGDVKAAGATQIPIGTTQTLEPKNLPEPTAEADPGPLPEYFVISMIGDCTFAGSQYIKGAAYSFEGVVGDDYAYPFAETLQFFEDDYLTIANLECTFSDQGLYPRSTFGFLAPTSYVNILKEGGVEFVTTANNHSNDFGEAGYEDTVLTLQNAGIGYAGDNEGTFYKTDNDPVIGIYAAGFNANGFDAAAGINSLKEAGADFIIAVFHWGLEGSYHETSSQKQLGHAAIDAGADLVYGCHPHVLQRVEEYEGTYIIYSLGNWSFGGNTSPRDLDSAIARATLMRDVDGQMSVTGLELIPCSISGTTGNNYQPVPYEEGSEGYMRALSKLDGTYTGPDLVVDYSYYHRDKNTGSPDEETFIEVTDPEATSVIG